MAHQDELVFDPELIRRFDINGPRYTSYPTADRFSEEVDARALVNGLGKRVSCDGGHKPLSLYFHIPFCSAICFYCACNKIATKDHDLSSKYLDALDHEMRLQTAALAGPRQVTQLHLGGGTPTFLSDDEFRRLMALVRAHFELVPDGEYSIEVDPRKVNFGTVELLASLGFNRMSVGVQDFTEAVQIACNRVQSFDETRMVMEAARATGFRSVSMDLIYGLPKQSVDSFDRTLDNVLELSPDRVSLYSYAHLPSLFMPQRRIVEADLPTADVKLQILQRAIRRLTGAGYCYIGMDHFAKPDDELTVAQRQGRLHRNFQGYSTQAECDMLAFGVSSIAKVGPLYAQNHKTLEAYYEALSRDALPVLRGIELSADDLIRRAAIQALMCHFSLSAESFGRAHSIDFNEYFKQERLDLKEMESAGLVQVGEDGIDVLPPGRLLVRAIAMVFDRYLRADRERKRYSRVI
ncbi:MAG: oxygen-independent coproporphyrinogen III oxidase [Azoarcus sp.]|nr:oxygen-independent coproporphyrinogen III oxidase [Azoarcus sp.]